VMAKSVPLDANLPATGNTKIIKTMYFNMVKIDN
jgi:hypothetical protein